jgi:hypothetical protein
VSLFFSTFPLSLACSYSVFLYATLLLLARHGIIAPVLGQASVILPLTATSHQTTLSDESSSFDRATATQHEDVPIVEDEDEDAIELSELGSLL